MEDERSQLLVVEDDDRTAAYLRDNLEADGFRVATAGGAGEALRAIEVRRPDLVVLDLVLGDASGLLVLDVGEDGRPRLAPASGTLRADLFA